MPVPTAISSLSQTAASNSPPGTESPTSADDYMRQQFAFIAMLRDGIGFTDPVQLASAATTSIGAQNSLFVEITGTTTITSFGSTYEGPRFLRFTGALTLTHNATTLNLPGGANIATAAGDTAIAIPNQTLNGWNVVQYQRSSVALYAGQPTSTIRLHTANGNGSTNTAVRRFTTTVTSQGSDITYADSATAGASFTVNTAGMYAISYCDNFNTTIDMGLSLNSGQLTTSIALITAADRLALVTSGGTNFTGESVWVGFLPAASVIRPHSSVSPTTGVAAAASFTISRVA